MPATATATAKSPRFTSRTAAADRSAARHARRRMIDPTTCERDYGPEELEFMQALDPTSGPAAGCFRPAARCSRCCGRWATGESTSAEAGQAGSFGSP